MEKDILEFLWKIGNDLTKSYPNELVDEAKDLFLKYGFRKDLLKKNKNDRI